MQVFPAAWRTVVVDDRYVARYPDPTLPLRDLDFCDRTSLAFLDYKTLRRRRERWLGMRVEGERHFLEHALDLTTNDYLDDPPPEMEMPKNVTFASLLLPQSMSQGWLTQYTDLGRNGARLWRGMQRYDAALLICMHACFQVTHNGSDNAPEGVSPENWLLYQFSPMDPFGAVQTNEDERTLDRLNDPQTGETPLRRVFDHPTASGIAILRRLYEGFMPPHMREEFATVVWNTARYTVARMMRAGDTPAARAEWLLREVRTGVLSHYTRHNVAIGSVFPNNDQPIYSGWEALMPNMQDVRPEILRAVRSVLFAGEPLQEGALMPGVVLFDQHRRAMSVFYTQAVAPLVIAAACAVGYLRAEADGRVLPGTGVPGTEPVATRPTRTSAESLRALTSYTLMRLHATLGGTVAGSYPGECDTQWHPADVKALVGPNHAVTAEKLMRTWQQTTEPDRHTWVRALEAALLFMVGGKAEQ